MMNIKDVLSPGEEVLFGTQQHRLVPGGKETSPGQIFVTTEHVIIETSKWFGLKKEYQDLHYSDIMNVVLKKIIWSSDIIINSRFQGQIVMKSIGQGLAPSRQIQITLTGAPLTATDNTTLQTNLNAMSGAPVVLVSGGTLPASGIVVAK